MFVKHGDGKIIEIIKDDKDLKDEQKANLEKKIEEKEEENKNLN